MNQVRKIVSKKKRRYQYGGFDLDLAYIRPNIIAMGYPADNVESVYRNSIVEVNRFLSWKHGDKFYVYNLCVENERQYDRSRFNNNVCTEFSFEDHNPPTIQMIISFCQHVETQLNSMADRTIVIHCKAGKGRTGVMSCCFLLYYYRDEYQDPLHTMRFYARQRTYNEKGVTIPSQRRYVEYFGHLLNSQVSYCTKKIIFTGLLISYEQNHVLNASLSYTVSSADHRRQYQSFEVLLERDTNISRTSLADPSVLNSTHKYFIPSADQQCQIPLEEDVLIEIFLSRSRRGKPEKICHFWFNTFFLVEPKMQLILNDYNEKYPESHLGVLKSYLIAEYGHKHLYTLRKRDIDGLHKDKLHRLAPATFTVSVLFEYAPSPPSIRIPVNPPVENKNTLDLKIIESNSDSSLIIGPAEALASEEDLNPGKDKLTETNNSKNLRPKKSRSNRPPSTRRRTFKLYANGVSDWDSTDSESGNVDTNNNTGESETCQTRL